MVVDRTRDRWRSINGTLGVDRLLMYGGEPQAVPVGVVEKLLAAADSQGNVRFDFHLKEGQAVKVTAGPFAELIGQLERLDDNGRVRVLLEILGGKGTCRTAARGCLPPRKTSPDRVFKRGGLMRSFFDNRALEYERGGSPRDAKSAARLFDDTNLADRLGAPYATRRLHTEREVRR